MRTRAQAFNEWMRRYTEEPSRFEQEFESVGRFLSEQANGETLSYGVTCDAYLSQLMLEDSPHLPTDERSGLECPDCGNKQKRLDIQREYVESEPRGGLFVRINYKIPAEKLASEVKGLCALLKRFLGARAPSWSDPAGGFGA